MDLNFRWRYNGSSRTDTCHLSVYFNDCCLRILSCTLLNTTLTTLSGCKYCNVKCGAIEWHWQENQLQCQTWNWLSLVKKKQKKNEWLMSPDIVHRNAFSWLCQSNVQIKCLFGPRNRTSVIRSDFCQCFIYEYVVTGMCALVLCKYSETLFLWAI